MSMTAAEYRRRGREEDYQRGITDAAERHGWLWFHDNDPRRNRRGFPDLVLGRPGLVLILELKSAKGRLRPEQAQWHEVFKTLYGNVMYFVVTPRNYDEVLRIISDPWTGQVPLGGGS